jgi:hypothetical protein
MLKSKKGVLATLFSDDYALSPCKCRQSVDDLLKQGLPLFALDGIITVRSDQESTEGFIETIKMKQNQPKIESLNLITQMTSRQQKTKVWRFMITIGKHLLVRTEQRQGGKMMSPANAKKL